MLHSIWFSQHSPYWDILIWGLQFQGLFKIGSSSEFLPISEQVQFKGYLNINSVADWQTRIFCRTSKRVQQSQEQRTQANIHLHASTRLSHPHIPLLTRSIRKALGIEHIHIQQLPHNSLDLNMCHEPYKPYICLVWNGRNGKDFLIYDSTKWAVKLCFARHSMTTSELDIN